MSKHSLFSASAAPRYCRCPASVRMGLNEPRIDDEFSSEGTLAHKPFEAFMQGLGLGKTLYETNQEIVHLYSPEMIAHARWAAEQMLKRATYDDAIFLSEQKVHFQEDKEIGGTLDSALVEVFSRLVVGDYKYGAGVPVDAKDNEQGLIYAISIAQRYNWNFQDCEILIFQPRCEVTDEPMSSAIYTMDELKAWHQKILKSVMAASDPNAPMVPGKKQCQFCPGAHKCEAVWKDAMVMGQVDFKRGQLVSVPMPEFMDNERLGMTLQACERLTSWIKQVKKVAMHKLTTGEHIPGYKMVEKKARRYWVNPDQVAVEAHLQFGADAFVVSPPVLLSPRQLELACGDKAWVKERVAKVSSGLKMVSDGDPGAAIDRLALDFPDLP